MTPTLAFTDSGKRFSTKAIHAKRLYTIALAVLKSALYSCYD